MCNQEKIPAVFVWSSPFESVVFATSPESSADRIREDDVQIQSPDGFIDAVIHRPPRAGARRAILVWPDALGLRPVFREMGRRLAAEGYIVLTPNPYYRSRPAPVITGSFDFGDPLDRQRLSVLQAPLTHEAVNVDALTLLRFLGEQPDVDVAGPMFVHGYCMGGALAVQTAAAAPELVSAVGSFHGAGLVTAEATSPHLLMSRSSAAFLFGIAQNDDVREPDVRQTLEQALAKDGPQGTIKVYPANHGWCVPDSKAFQRSIAAQAFADLLQHYRTVRG